MRHSGLSAALWTKGLLVRFPIKAHHRGVCQVPSRAHARGNHTLMFPSLSPSLPLSLKINQSLNTSFFKIKEQRGIEIHGVLQCSCTEHLYCWPYWVVSMIYPICLSTKQWLVFWERTAVSTELKHKKLILTLFSKHYKCHYSYYRLLLPSWV